MNRDQWEFSFPVSMVKKAAINKAEYHESRLEDWQQRLKESEQKIHDQAGVNEIPVTGGNRLEIAVPDDLASEYKTSKKKVEHHDEKMETYDRWVRSLDHLENEGGPHVLVLDIDDVEFFGL